MSKNIKCITLTVLTESPFPLSYDQGFGNYSPIKKIQYKNGVHASTSVGTFTYELRRILHKDFGWNLSGIVLNKNGKGEVKNLYSSLNNVERTDEYGLETDIFGFMIPDKALSKVSPLRIIPFLSLNKYKGSTQLITNRGFLDRNFERNYYDNEGNEIARDENFPTTQALATEEVMGDYYVYTITIELDRIGVVEVEKGKYLLPEERKYMSKELREKAVKDIVMAITLLRREIKHGQVLLKPLAVFGGAFDMVVPYFWNDVEYDDENNAIKLDSVAQTVESYELDKNGLILAVDNRVKCKRSNDAMDVSNAPVKAIKELMSRIEVGDDNMWYLKEK